jgi:hypothetical protein
MPRPFHDGSVNKSNLLKDNSLLTIAPNFAESQHTQVRDMILINRLVTEITDVVGYSDCSVAAIKSNLRC